MEWILIRTYFPNGSNGSLWCGSQLICHTIELPWLNNRRRISCIPEGRYELSKYYSRKFGNVFQLIDVFDRDYILIHPANNALEELKGCIAPVVCHTGQGKGLHSKVALDQMSKIANLSLAKHGKLFLNIKSLHHEHS